MKNIKKLLALALVVMMLATAFGAMSVHAEISQQTHTGKLFVSHFNQSDVYSNTTAIFTKEFMGTKTLGDLADEYVASVNEKMMSVDAEWTGKYSGEIFKSFMGMVCAWNEENGRYEIIQTAMLGPTRSLTCPDNGFLLVMHKDENEGGRHNYPSNAFADLNFGNRQMTGMRSIWVPLVGQPVYLYNIDLEKLDAGSGIQTSGTFDSKISPAGLDNGMREIYNNFKTESYIYVGEEDPEATVEFFEPKNITVSFSKIEKLEDEFSKLDFFEYDENSWNAVESLFEKYGEDYAANEAGLKNKDVTAWADEIRAAMDAMIAGETVEVEDTDIDVDVDQGGTVVTPGGNSGTTTNNGGDNTLIFIIAGVVGVLVIAGVVFIILAGKKKKAPAAAEAKEEAAAETKEEE